MSSTEREARHRLDTARRAFLGEWAEAARRLPAAEMRDEIDGTAAAMSGLVDLSFDTMVASCMRWFGMERRQAEQHVEVWVEAGALCCRRTCSRFGSALRRR